MKKILTILVSCILITSLFTACEEEETYYDDALLIGKWSSGTLYYKYLVDGFGTTWDTSDDVTEEEGQQFTWALEKSELTHIHILEMGGTVPKVYTVTELTATTLKYKDDFGKTFSFTKVSN
jgi:hypothetical protein